MRDCFENYGSYKNQGAKEGDYYGDPYYGFVGSTSSKLAAACSDCFYSCS